MILLFQFMFEIIFSNPMWNFLFWDGNGELKEWQFRWSIDRYRYAVSPLEPLTIFLPTATIAGLEPRLHSRHDSFWGVLDKCM